MTYLIVTDTLIVEILTKFILARISESQKS